MLPSLYILGHLHFHPSTLSFPLFYHSHISPSFPLCITPITFKKLLSLIIFYFFTPILKSDTSSFKHVELSCKLGPVIQFASCECSWLAIGKVICYSCVRYGGDSLIYIMKIIFFHCRAFQLTECSGFKSHHSSRCCDNFNSVFSEYKTCCTLVFGGPLKLVRPFAEVTGGGPSSLLSWGWRGGCGQPPLSPASFCLPVSDGLCCCALYLPTHARGPCHLLVSFCDRDQVELALWR